MQVEAFERTWSRNGWTVFETVLKPSLFGKKSPIPTLGVFRRQENGNHDLDFRFLLLATVTPTVPATLGVLAMNPSKALQSEAKSDRTVSRLINYLRYKADLGYGRILLGNCFAKYETYSTKVTADSPEITKLNDKCLKYLFENCNQVVLASGGASIVKDRLRSILKTSAETCSLKCLGQKGWVGSHPSRGSYDAWELGEYDKSPLFT